MKCVNVNAEPQFHIDYNLRSLIQKLYVSCRYKTSQAENTDVFHYYVIWIPIFSWWFRAHLISLFITIITATRFYRHCTTWTLLDVFPFTHCIIITPNMFIEQAGTSTIMRWFVHAHHICRRLCRFVQIHRLPWRDESNDNKSHRRVFFAFERRNKKIPQRLSVIWSYCRLLSFVAKTTIGATVSLNSYFRQFV